MIFDAANNWLRHQGETKLIVTSRPVVAVVHAPADPAGDKLWSNLVTVGIAEHAEQVTGLKRDVEPGRIKRFRRSQAATAGEKWLSQERCGQNSRAGKVH